MKVRPAQRSDIPVIVSIYNEAVVGSVATFDSVPQTLAERESWFEKQEASGDPALVCEDESGGVVGFAYYQAFRAKDGYARTKETTVYVASACHRRGVGAVLYEELIRLAVERGVHVLVAVLGGRNLPSERLHEKFGFKLAGHFPEVGRKFDGWVDTYTYLRILGE